MSFMLRAALVVGLLTFLAMRQDGGGRTAPDVIGRTPALTAADAEIRALGMDALMRAAADGTLLDLTDATLSRDTLSQADRRPAWRGAQSR